MELCRFRIESYAFSVEMFNFLELFSFFLMFFRNFNQKRVALSTKCRLENFLGPAKIAEISSKMFLKTRRLLSSELFSLICKKKH